MMRNLIAAVQGSGEVPAFEANVEVVSCHHNYVTWEHHYGENVLITRKARYVHVKATWELFPEAWGRVRTLCAARGIRKAS
jgi:tRNA-splicing ligase RtcB (3'-phosphate/5'-hydroxy nucleic acid ligase)